MQPFIMLEVQAVQGEQAVPVEQVVPVDPVAAHQRD
jgi:hypothetical protein